MCACVRADNLVFVSVSRVFRRSVLDLVLKTSNSARLVLLKFNEPYAKWWWWARPHVQIHSIDRSGQICNIWRSCNTKSVARYDHQVVADRQKRACSFCAVREPCTEMSPWLAVMIRTSNLTWYFEHRDRNRFQRLNLEWLKDVRIFRVSADNVSK